MLFRSYFIEAEAEINKQKEHKQQLIGQYASVTAERVRLKENKEDDSIEEGIFDSKPKVDFKVRAKELFTKGLTEQQVLQQLIKEGCPPNQAAVFVQGAQLEEAPIDMSGDPNDPMIYGHEKANPMSLKGRIMQARAQLKDLAMRAESNDLVTWERICRDTKGGLFMGLEQNLEQIRHGISELAAKRKKGGVSSKGIDKNIGEEKQRLDPKCWKGYKKAGTKMKGGVRVNNCVPKGKKE